MIIMIIANDASFELATTIKTKNKCSFFLFSFSFFFNWMNFMHYIIIMKNTASIVGEILDMWVINITGYQEGTQVKWLADCSFVYGKCKNHKNVYKGQVTLLKTNPGKYSS